MLLSVLAPIPPNALLAILQLYGYKIIEESAYNWVLAREEDDVPLLLPKLGSAVPVEVMENAFEHSGMTLEVYFALKQSLGNGDLFKVN